MKLILATMALLLSGISCSTYHVTMASSSAGVSIIDDRSEAVELYRELNLSTCLIRAETGLGSGVILSRDLVLTAAHVVSHSPIVADDNGNPKRGEPEIEKCVIIKNAPGIPFLVEAKVIKIDYELDLAVLRLARVWPFTIAKLATFDPYLYQKAWASGHPHGVTDTEITEGRIQDLWDDGFIRYSSPTTFGNSGGPVFIREDGRLKVSSIVQRVHTEGGGVAVNHLGLGALPENVRDFMRDYSGE